MTTRCKHDDTDFSVPLNITKNVGIPISLSEILMIPGLERAGKHPLNGLLTKLTEFYPSMNLSLCPPK